MAERKNRQSWRKKWVPHPLMSLVLIYLWTGLLNDLSLGALVSGSLLGILIPIITRNIWDRVPKITSVGRVVVYLVIVLWDIIVANLQVALLILFRPNSQLKSQWVTVPLDLKSPEAIAALAITVSLTPGTVSCDLSADSSSLLVHALDTRDGPAEAEKIKRRYEARLLRIFE
jgi:multicomponent K+:H+ antiporter subunit E